MSTQSRDDAVKLAGGEGTVPPAGVAVEFFAGREVTGRLFAAGAVHRQDIAAPSRLFEQRTATAFNVLLLHPVTRGLLLKLLAALRKLGIFFFQAHYVGLECLYLLPEEREAFLERRRRAMFDDELLDQGQGGKIHG